MWGFGKKKREADAGRPEEPTRASGPSPEPEQVSPPAPESTPEPVPGRTSQDEAFDRVCAARDAAWASVGTVDPYVVAPIINPAFLGGPRWPGLRQSFRRIETAAGYGIVTSDGLADPFDDDSGRDTGLGVELFLAADVFQTTAVAGLRDLWQFDAIYQTAQNIAAAGLDLGAELDRYGAVSLGLPGSGAPNGWLDADGSIGILIGLSLASVPAAVPVPAPVGGSQALVRLIGCAALRPDELDAILTHGASARRDIAERLGALAPDVLASGERPSVLI
ncbi:hypothetical protein ACPEEZ_12580 [Frigoribacterium sp. 2-23]|uniref:hypothetical protein n=1 Tax=Frigoribacterium sp. 2-23 TaxID=3415006 RepID=UPI003C6F5A63